jgi:protein O-GlcNAc transferase
MLRGWVARALVASGARHERRGDLARAKRRYRAAAALAPRHAPAWLNLGAALEAAGDLAAAERAYASLRAADPGDPHALYNLARLRHARGESAAAEAMLGAALALKPEFPDALVLRAALQEARGELGLAAASLERALELRPGHAGTWYNLAELSWKLLRPAQAEQALRRAAEATPVHAIAAFQVARLELARGRNAQAERLLELALHAAPDFVDALCMRCGLRTFFERFDEAEGDARRAVAADASSATAAYSLGLVLRAQARIGESLAALAQARRLAPGRFDLEPAELLVTTLSDAVTPQAAFERHRDYGRRLEAAVAPRFRAWRGTRDPERRLRVGFVSCDFRRHPVSWFLLPLLERLDRARVESVCYYTGERADEITAQVKAAADDWVEAAALDDDALADAIERDAIDILLDLTGHAGEFRLGVFARQAAPVQASWLGYLHSTGLTRIGWRITDARADPPGRSEALHTERLARLPHSLWCFRPPLDLAQAPPRAAGGTVFVSSHQLAKVSPTARRLWAEILRRIPQARLLMLGVPRGSAREDLLRDFEAAGVGSARLELRPRLPLREYYRSFDAADIALDTMPYGGGTTTFDALWLGLPVLTLAGERSAGRSAASILGAIGLDDWIAGTADDYVRLALAHAADSARLAHLRATLRARLQNSPLMDEAGFARDMEALLRGLWREWCAGAIT